MKRSILIILLFIISIRINSQSVYQFNWALAEIPSTATGATGDNDLAINKITTNSNNEIVVAGTYFNNVDLDPSSTSVILPNLAASRNCFFAKYTTSGNLIWAKPIRALNLTGSSGEVAIRDMVVDNNDDIIIVGSFSGSADFDPSAGVTSYSTSAGSQIFIAKYNGSTGALVFANRLSSGAVDCELFSCTVDGFNNIYVAGNFVNAIDLDPSTNNANFTAIGGTTNNYEAFFAKYSSTGAYIYGKQLGGTGKQYGRKICIDKSNNLVVSGYSDAGVDMDPSTAVKSLSSSPFFIGKYTITGNYIWAGKFGSIYNQYSEITDLKTDSLNNIYLLGVFNTATMDAGIDLYGGSSVTINLSNYSSGAVTSEGFILKVDSNGINNAQASTLTLGDDYLSRLHVKGNNIISFAMFSKNGQGGRIAEFNTFDNSLNYDSFCSAGSINGVRVKSYYVDALKNTYVGGYYMGTTDLDPNTASYTINSGSNTDIGLFMAKYNDSRNCQQPPMPIVSDTLICQGNSVVLSALGTGTLNWYDTNNNWINSGSTFSTGILNNDTTFYVRDSTCMQSDISTLTVSVSICTGINESLEDMKFEIYPNPTNNSFTIRLNEYGNCTILLYNALGEQIKNIRLKDEYTIVDLTELPSGIYYIQLVKNGNVSTRKIIKE